LGSQAPANNLRRFSTLHLADLKNRTGIGSHPTASKNQQIQAPLTDYVRSSELRAIFGAERVPRSRFHRFAGTRRAYQRFLLAFGRLRERPLDDRFAELRQEYARCVVEVRGLSASSRYQHAHTVAEFLARGLRPRQSLSSLSRADIERYILLRSRKVTRQSLQHTVAHVRAFLRYAHDMHHLSSRLDALDTPLSHRGELPPRAVPWPMVKALLASIDRQSKAGWRDFCILHLVSHYGLRPSEIVTIRLDSIDWNTGVLHVYQCKTSTELVLPLAQPTLQLLRSYVRHERARYGDTHRELFLRARCPYGPLERYAVGDLYQKRVRESGLPLIGSSVYCLRHTFAVRLLGKGRKTRLCPLWPATARLLRGLMAEAVASAEDPASRLLFTNARGGTLTRYGVRYLLRRYVKKAAQVAPTLHGKKLHPHSLRHSTAVALLKAGVDFATIGQWLGHAGLNTTMRYARADLDLKRQALSQVFPDALAPPRGGRLLIDASDLVGWLRRV
jgi:integrase/recombinase XerD